MEPQKNPGETNTSPILNPKLGWLTVLAGYALFTITLVFQTKVNLWLLALVTTGILLPMCYLSYGGNSRRVFGLSWRALLAGIAGALMLSVATYLLWPPMVSQWPSLAPFLQQCYENLQVWPGKYWALPIIFLLVLTEEWIWRGLLLDLLTPKLKAFGLIVVCTLLFPLPHLLTGNLILLVAALFLGLLCNVLRHRYRSLVVPLITHFGWNLSVMIFFPLIP